MAVFIQHFCPKYVTSNVLLTIGFGIQCLVQGCFNMWAEGAGDLTTNPVISGQPALPLSHKKTHHTSVLDTQPAKHFSTQEIDLHSVAWTHNPNGHHHYQNGSYLTCNTAFRINIPAVTQMVDLFDLAPWILVQILFGRLQEYRHVLQPHYNMYFLL